MVVKLSLQFCTHLLPLFELHSCSIQIVSQIVGLSHHRLHVHSLHVVLSGLGFDDSIHLILTLLDLTHGHLYLGLLIFQMSESLGQLFDLVVKRSHILLQPLHIVLTISECDLHLRQISLILQQIVFNIFIDDFLII